MTRHIAAALLTLLMTVPAWSYTRDEVLLHVPFDGSAVPLVHAGEVEPDIQGEATYTPGMVGEAITVGREDVQLRYPTAGNMNPEEGTWSIWVQSINWDFKGEKVNRWWIDCMGPTRFILYHYLHSGGVFFYHMDERRDQPSIIRAGIDWQPGDWHHLATTWRDGRLRLYIDAERVPEELNVELGPIGEWLQIGTPGTHPDDTLIDDLYVFSRALEDVEIKALYERGTRDDQPALVAPKITAPALDGVIDDAEWSAAAAVTGYINRVTGSADTEQGVAFIGWDDTNLYMAHKWPIPEKVRQEPDLYSFGPVQKKTVDRDDPALLQDDAVGMTVERDGQIIGIMANALGTILDIRDRDLAWDANVQAASVLGSDWWVCEMSVPLADLGLAAGDTFGAKIGRSHRLLRHDECAWPATDPDVYAQVTLADGPAVQLTSIGQPWAGQVDVTLAAVGAPAQLTVASNTGQIAETTTVSLAGPSRITAPITDMSVTALTIEAKSGDQTLLAATVPFTYPPMLEVDRFFYPSLDRMDVIVNTRGAASAAAASVQLLPPGGGDALRTADAPANTGDARTIPVDVAGLAPGEYPVRVTIGGGDATLAEQQFTLEILEKPEWLGSTVGIIDYVPKPWTPMTFDADKVSCWGREVDLTGGAFPVQMVSQGQSLLAQPVRLVATIAGQEQTLGAATLTWTERDDQVARWTASAKMGPVDVTVDAFMEYDGLLWFEVTMNADAVTLDSLRLEVPMAKQQSTLIYTGDYRTIDTGLTPTEPWAKGFTPAIGLSNEQVGMQWYAESRRGWNLSDLDRALEVIPSDSANTLVANIMDAPTTLTGDRAFAFGLHPTPVRPPLEGRRMIRPNYGAKYEPEGPKPNTALWWTHFSLGCSYNWPILEERIQHVQNRQNLDHHKVCAYTRLCECSVKGPWYAYFRDEWRQHPGPRKAYNEEVGWDAAGNPVCPQSRSWDDFTVWATKKAAETLGFDALYYDVSRPPACSNAAHGCGYTDERAAKAHVDHDARGAGRPVHHPPHEWAHVHDHPVVLRHHHRR